ncbi:MAG: aminoacyl-tRNA hydrolase [Lachnospiraceae bacterium]|nr:aminoacyl-tRNA hydrolase [Lachnospiraceae bacterium]
MKLIFGLGNFGDKYNHTRHNMGFEAVEILAKRLGISFDREKCKGMYAQGFIEGEKVILVKPLTYMNNSGECVAAWLRKCMVTAENMIVVYDDISLEPGVIRVRPKGSAGGHNGMKNIIALTGTQEFDRVRIGIGDKPEGTDLVDHVLGRFAPKDFEAIDKGLETAADAIVSIIRDGMDKAMNVYNKKPLAVKKETETSSKKDTEQKTDGALE